MEEIPDDVNNQILVNNLMIQKEAEPIMEQEKLDAKELMREISSGPGQNGPSNNLQIQTDTFSRNLVSLKNRMIRNIPDRVIGVPKFYQHLDQNVKTKDCDIHYGTICLKKEADDRIVNSKLRERDVHIHGQVEDRFNMSEEMFFKLFKNCLKKVNFHMSAEFSESQEPSHNIAKLDAYHSKSYSKNSYLLDRSIRRKKIRKDIFATTERLELQEKIKNQKEKSRLFGMILARKWTMNRYLFHAPTLVDADLLPKIVCAKIIARLDANATSTAHIASQDVIVHRDSVKRKTASVSNKGMSAKKAYVTDAWTTRMIVSCPKKRSYGSEMWKPHVSACNRNSFKNSKVKSTRSRMAKRDIKKGEIVGEYTGEQITDDQADRRGQVYHYGTSYVYHLPYAIGALDSAKAGNETRFINHSNTPNLTTIFRMSKGEPRVGFVADQDIRKDEEVFFPYGYSEETLKFLFSTKPGDSMNRVLGRQGRKIREPSRRRQPHRTTNRDHPRQPTKHHLPGNEDRQTYPDHQAPLKRESISEHGPPSIASPYLFKPLFSTATMPRLQK
ncbi:Protein CBG02011 [Caenorhabditis briggsae]|uniref:Protein CBG02011 n=2 Tax=Caenorhabditis briggsae TaxID=6238 RepID=A8WRT0_CAEBR|nr:Protein CBG02011 [Caenorhabditis briggsae]CAP23188.2 Protein CBG02011 [Caenorhabditis briggsae]